VASAQTELAPISALPADKLAAPAVTVSPAGTAMTVASAMTVVPAPAVVAPVDPLPARPAALGERGFWVQLGAFRERSGAESFQGRVAGDVDWLAPLLATFADASLYRVQAGPYANRDEAQGAAQRVREALGLVPMIVERR
jgi:rare lipoprotein A